LMPACLFSLTAVGVRPENDGDDRKLLRVI
jgi:hypothetical protein